MKRKILLIGLLIFTIILSGCILNPRPQAKGINCEMIDEVKNDCIIALMENCEIGYGGVKGERGEAYYQIYGVENEKCHIYMDGTMGLITGWADCNIPKNSLDKYFPFEVNRMEVCTGSFVDMLK